MGLCASVETTINQFLDVDAYPLHKPEVLMVILQGLPSVIFYLDDILVTRASNQEHLKNLEELLARLKKNGLRLKKSKCSFMQSSIIYYKHLQKIHENPTPEPELLQTTWG